MSIGGYKYSSRISITATSEPGSFTDLVVPVTMFKGAGANAVQDGQTPAKLYCDSKCEDFPNDIRVTDAVGNELNHRVKRKRSASNYSVVQDAFMWGGDTWKTGALDYLRLNDISTTTARIILDFDLSAFSGNLSDAILKLNYYAYLNSAPTGKYIQVFKLDPDNDGSDWVEAEVDDFQYATGENWDTQGGDYKTDVPNAIAIMPGAYGDVFWDITSIVQDAIDNCSGKVRLLVRYRLEIYGSACNINFKSSEHATEADRPQLFIGYENDSEVDIEIEVADDLGENQNIKVYFGKSGETSASSSDGYLSFDDASGYNVEGIIDAVGTGGVGSVHRLTDGTVYKLVEGILYKSEDDGETWIYLSTPFGSYSEGSMTSDGTSSNIWVLVREADSDVYVKKSIDGGETWGGAVTVETVLTVSNPYIFYESSGNLLVTLVQADLLIRVYHSPTVAAPSFTYKGYAIDTSPQDVLRREHPCMTRAANGDLLIGYEHEFVEGGKSHLYQVRSLAARGDWDEWEAEELIYSGSDYDNENGLYALMSNDDLWYIFVTDEDSTGGSYAKAIIKGCKSVNHGVDWANPVVLYDSKSKVSPHGLIVLNANEVKMWCLKHWTMGDASTAEFTSFIINVNSPVLFSNWTQLQGSLNAIDLRYLLSSEDDYSQRALCMSGHSSPSEYGVAVIGGSIADYAIECEFKPLNSGIYTSIPFRIVDEDNYYFVILRPNTAQIYKVVAGSPTQLDSEVYTAKDEWQTLKVGCYTDGSDLKIKVYIDGILYNDFTENPITHVAGKAGLHSYKDAGQRPSFFADFRVYPYVDDYPVVGEPGPIIKGRRILITHI